MWFQKLAGIKEDFRKDVDRAERKDIVEELYGLLFKTLQRT